jgi:uncharacterized membrane protein/predicted RNA-binding Zn-ribbon protein involved in translation (DUF1610 family)
MQVALASQLGDNPDMDTESSVGRHCKKCGHIRKREDVAPDYSCPACGAVYAKVRAAEHQREELAREAARNVDYQVFQPPAPPPPPKSLAAERRRVGLVQTGYILQLIPLGITAVVGAVIVKRVAVADGDSWLASHSRWQLRTFATALVIGAFLIAFAILLMGGERLGARMDGGVPVGRSSARWLWLPAAVLWLWVMYRVARGWLMLVRGESV